MASQGSPTWQSRNARARALGYSSYYDYRAHDYGRRAPSEPRARGDELARLRGHRGAGDLNRILERGQVELVNVIQTSTDPPELEVLLTLSDGSTQTYRVKGARQIGRVKKTIDRLGPQAPQIVGSPGARRGIAGVATDPDEEMEHAEHVAESEELSGGSAPDDSDIPF